VLAVCLIPRGSKLVLFDGEGQECEARLVGVVEGLAQVEATSPSRVVAAELRLELVMGLPRKPAWERILRMGTELGVTAFRPFLSRHSVARGEHLQRWERLVQSAAQQCGRGDLPRVHGLEPLEGMEFPPTRLALVPGTARAERPDTDLALLIGPEGGLTPGEIEGWQAVGLGPFTLRTDTAAVAAISLYAPTR